MKATVAKQWIRNASDRGAVENGCRFDPTRGQHVLNFARKFLRLYEGEKAGQPLEPMPWQVDFVMRLFGWVRWSDRYGRWIRRFTRAGLWVPKKNGKSPTLAWLGLYLLCADGEMGQKVFFGAKDGNQAREIAGKHAAEMLISSPELLAECSLNKSLLQITHEPTRSILKPLSSGDSGVVAAKEGLNGSVLIDETHVVDRSFIDRISRAGISRSEPLQIEVSTAGDDPEGYGKEQWDYGRLVESGERTDERYLFVAYAAPQELTDEDLAADPVKYGKLANPSWGNTVNEEEFLDDYNRSKSSITALSLFKKYRLNIWQTSSNPWLRVDDWKRCKAEFAEVDLLGRSCFGGLDLAKTRDMCAWVLVFPWPELGEEMCRIWPTFFMPENAARQNNDKVPFLEWARRGLIVLTPGDVCDYSWIKKRIADDAERFLLQDFAYDPYNAEELTQWVEENHGVRRVLFPQTIVHYAEPTAEFERRVIAGLLQHSGNAVMDWEIGHVQVKCDPNNNKRPIKPPSNDLRKIDGVVGGIMGLARCLASPVADASIRF